MYIDEWQLTVSENQYYVSVIIIPEGAGTCYALKILLKMLNFLLTSFLL